MLRSLHGPRAGLVVFEPLNRRQRLARRRVLVVSALVGLALASGLIGVLSGAQPAPTTAVYLPSR